ncbi:hypothetical protein HY745_00730, partial [Candidatus Desantisbacteria bacterium]|nr:hypothetical protein [Candidatus Desantisbacteria bacterium]
MLSKGKYLTILLVFLFVISISIYGETSNNMEKGDLVYRQLDLGLLGWVDYHTAIYMGYRSGNPKDDKNQLITEQMDKGTVTKGIQIDTTLYSLKQIDDYIGATTSKNGLTTNQRNGIINLARNDTSFSKPYVEDYKKYIVQWNDRNNDSTLQKEEIRNLRCDGLTEVIYALNGIQIQGDIIKNTVWYEETEMSIIGRITKRRPKTQFEAMSTAIGNAPTITVTDSLGNEIKSLYGVTFDKKITVKVDDGVNGSGVC